MPEVSIITVCRNEAARIGRTAESVARQACRDFEWIVVDGASTDGTLAILDRYGKHVSELISEPDGGIYDAMNKGILRARGDYCIFINGGDELYDEHAIERFVQFDNKAEYNYAGIIDVYGDRKVPKHVIPINDLKNYLYEASLPHQSSYILRQLFTKYGYYNTVFRVLADQEFCKRVIVKHGASVAHLPWINSVYYVDGISFKLKKTPAVVKEYKTIQRIYYKYAYRVRHMANRILGSL